MQQTENDTVRKSEGCPILRHIYAWHFIVSILYKSITIKNEAKQREI